MKSTFDLSPFTRNTAPTVNISGNIERQNNQLKILYRLEGSSQIIIPQIVNSPTRQDNLWEHTCCELFIGLQNSTKYWEFNLSPAGDWNVFRFPDYRQYIAEEMVFDSLPFRVLQQADWLQLQLEVNLNKIIPPEQSLKVGVTTVIEDRERQLSYWALTHPAPEANFHHRDSLIIDL
ncbi:MAG: DOMON-like domain-containing protein [Pleurocapsa sp.]